MEMYFVSGSRAGKRAKGFMCNWRLAAASTAWAAGGLRPEVLLQNGSRCSSNTDSATLFFRFLFLQLSLISCLLFNHFSFSLPHSDPCLLLLSFSHLIILG